jgi:hypothetical protein
VTLWVLILAGSVAAAHPTPVQDGDPAARRPTPREMASYAALLGQPPVWIVELGDKMEIAVVASPSGRTQLALIDWYLKDAQRMPTVLEAGVRISRIRLLGDMVAFQAEERDATVDYLWSPEESGPPYWKRVQTGSGATDFSPNLAGNRVAVFYLRDPDATRKLAAAEARRMALHLPEPVYIDSAVLILAAAGGGRNLALRWAGERWEAAGEIPGVVNHHAVADLNGDGMVEVLAGDSAVEQRCTRSWSALYTWNAAKTRVVETPIRANSISNLTGACDRRPPACYQEESLTWDLSAQPLPVIELKGTQDTTGAACTPQGQAGARKSYLERYRWDAAKAAFELLRP